MNNLISMTAQKPNVCIDSQMTALYGGKFVSYSSTCKHQTIPDPTRLPVAAARQSFKEQEALVYQQLAQLIRDAVWLKSYIAAVMRLEQEAFQSAYASLGPSKATLPLQQEMPAQSEQMMMTTGSTISQPMNMAPQVTNECCHHHHQLLPS